MVGLSEAAGTVVVLVGSKISGVSPGIVLDEGVGAGGLEESDGRVGKTVAAGESVGNAEGDGVGDGTIATRSPLTIKLGPSSRLSRTTNTSRLNCGGREALNDGSGDGLFDGMRVNVGEGMREGIATGGKDDVDDGIIVADEVGSGDDIIVDVNEGKEEKDGEGDTGA